MPDIFKDSIVSILQSVFLIKEIAVSPKWDINTEGFTILTDQSFKEIYKNPALTDVIMHV